MGISIKKNIVIPKELMGIFNNQIRITDFKQTQGIWPVDLRKLKGVGTKLNEIGKSKNIRKEFDIVLSYKGRNIKADLERIGILTELPKIKKFRLIGIPVPDFRNKNFNVILSPKR